MVGMWLLLLGSNLETDARIHAALAALGELGSITPVTAIQRLPSHGEANAPDYYNVLATLESDLDRCALVAALKRIEQTLGRQHAGPCVAIDIDMLAQRVDTRWVADAHAAAKGEAEHLPTRLLLRDAAIKLYR